MTPEMVLEQEVAIVVELLDKKCTYKTIIEGYGEAVVRQAEAIIAARNTPARGTPATTPVSPVSVEQPQQAANRSPEVSLTVSPQPAPEPERNDPLPFVPAEFKTYSNWVTWQDLGRKAPIISGTFDNARSDDPSTWVSYATALENIKNGKGYANLGFVTDGERTDYLTALDIDGCRNPETGQITEWAQRILNALPATYAEITPSKTGIRPWVKMLLPDNAESVYKLALSAGHGSKVQIEVYSDRRYFTMTGDKLGNAAAQVASMSDETRVNNFFGLLKSLEAEFPASSKESKEPKVKRAKLVTQPDGTLRFEPIPPDPAFKELQDRVGWGPLENRLHKMQDSRFHAVELKAGKLSFCPMPQHAPRGKDVHYGSACFGVVSGHEHLVHCFGCGYTGDLVKTVKEFDAGEEGGKVEHQTMYDCARAICREEGLNPDEYFPEQNSLQNNLSVGTVADQLQAAVQETAPAPDGRLTVTDIKAQLDEAMLGRELPWTHGAAADFFDVLFGENFLYSILGKSGNWMSWNNHMWHEGNIDVMLRRMDNLLKRVRTQIIPTLKAVDENTFNVLRALEKQCANANFMNGVMRMLQSKRLVRFEEFDPEDKSLLNFLNGTYELGTSVFRESRREDRLTQTLPVAYVPSAACPTWIKFLENSFPDSDVREFLQRFFGYMLEGTSREKYTAFFHGYGDNGKTILMSVLMAIFGYKSDNSYGKAVGWETFVENRNGAIRNDIARLHNARAVFCDESEQGMVMKESMFKAITGMSPITARFLYKEYSTFFSKFVFILATNRLPRVIGGDGASWKRILKIPMTQSFPVGHPKRIDNLKPLLMAEVEGIAQWIVEGYRKYKVGGLRIPQSILDASAEYRENSDVIEWFLAENIQEAAGVKIRFDDVYARYADWCHRKNEKEQSRDGLIDILKSRGYQTKRAMNETGRPLYVYGMKLTPDLGFLLPGRRLDVSGYDQTSEPSEITLELPQQANSHLTTV